MLTVNPNIRFLLLTNGIILFSGALLGPIYALFVEDIGGDLLDAGLAGFVFAFSAGLMSYIVGKKGDLWSHKGYALSLGYAIIACGFFLYLYVDSMALLFVAQVIIGFGEALYSPVFDALYSQNLDRGKFSSEWGLWECMNYWVTSVAALLGALLVDTFGFYPLFVVMGILALLSAVYVFIWSYRKA